MKTIAISQSNYVPWKGYFDLIQSVDEFVIYDTVQYSKNDWRNRNVIKTGSGLKWLTIPVRGQRLDKRINEVEIADARWRSRHPDIISQHYRNAAAYASAFPWLSDRYERCADMQRLSDVNRFFLSELCDALKIQTPLLRAEDFNPAGERNARLISICEQAGARCYLSGPAAKSYLDVDLFREHGIEVRWMDYDGYRQYPQLHGAFEHRVSIIDLILNVGMTDAPRYVRRGVTDGAPKRP